MISSSIFMDIGIEKEHLLDYEDLRKGTGKYNNSPFKTLDNYDIFLVAMAIGAVRGKRKPLKSRVNLIPYRKFVNGYGEALITALVIAEEGSLAILSDYEKMFRIIEEYANGGLEILIEQILLAQGNIYLELEDHWRIYITDTRKKFAPASP